MDEQVERQIFTNLIGSIQLICGTISDPRKQGVGGIVQTSSKGGHVRHRNTHSYLIIHNRS